MRPSCGHQQSVRVPSGCANSGQRNTLDYDFVLNFQCASAISVAGGRPSTIFATVCASVRRARRCCGCGRSGQLANCSWPQHRQALRGVLRRSLAVQCIWLPQQLGAAPNPNLQQDTPSWVVLGGVALAIGLDNWPIAHNCAALCIAYPAVQCTRLTQQQHAAT